MTRRGTARTQFGDGAARVVATDGEIATFVEAAIVAGGTWRPHSSRRPRNRHEPPREAAVSSPFRRLRRYR